jgi:23S rRNA pseudouridine2605 synthase
VLVNGKLAILGQKADSGEDHIVVDGKPLRPAPALRYVALYKPRNVISTTDDPGGRKTVNDLVPDSNGLYPVGRLDWDSEGLVLLTNDGELANRLTHPRYGHTKEYRVLVARRPEPEQLAAWRRGIVLSDGHRSLPAEVYTDKPSGKGMWLRITMGEGRKRQIRDVGSLLGLPVVRIVRERIGSLRLGNLKPGSWRSLTKPEIDDLQSAAGGPAKPDPPARRSPRHRIRTRRT